MKLVASSRFSVTLRTAEDSMRYLVFHNEETGHSVCSWPLEEWSSLVAYVDKQARHIDVEKKIEHAERHTRHGNPLCVGHPKGKTRYDLVPPNALEEIALVLQWASELGKYKEWSWMTENRPWTYYFASALRHTWEWFRGERNDSESGRHHLAHAITRLMFLIEHDKLTPELDDRPYTKATRRPK